LRVKRTRRGSTTSTLATLAFSRLALAPRYRSKEYFTSSAVMTSPLWKRTFFRSTNS
jgi:hypothetical protein